MTHQYPPLNYFYSHFHDSIKAELASLVKWVQQLSGDGVANESQLLELRERYKFLEQVYKYHSSVEDEVVYPALDAKVKNVTLAYSVEHQDEELLFEQLAQLISTAVDQQGAKRDATVRGLMCKVEEIHTTLKKHLAKEEEQLLPLLLKHFSFAEQAGLVAQFLYCIPLAAVGRVLAWLKPRVPQVEQEQLLQHIQAVLPDQLLLQLLTSWLQPISDGLDSLPSPAASPTPPSLASSGRQDSGIALSAFTTTHRAAYLEGSGCEARHSSGQATLPGGPELGDCAGVNKSPYNVQQQLLVSQHHQHHQAGAQPVASGGSQYGLVGAGGDVMRHAPIQELQHIHRTICSALEEFAREARQLQQRQDVSAGQLAALVERHRFLRSLCMFHTMSEEEVMYPAVRRLLVAHPAQLVPESGWEAAHAACMACEREHACEVSALEDLGRLLADVRALARRGRKEVAALLGQLSSSAEQVRGNVAEHMAREEVELFPLLARHLCASQQRAMLWHTLHAMPLRLLERLMPWVTAGLSHEEAEELMNNIRLGAPEGDQALVQLLSCWAERGRVQGTQEGWCRGSSPGAGEGLGLGSTPSQLACISATSSGQLGGGAGGDAADRGSGAWPPQLGQGQVGADHSHLPQLACSGPWSQGPSEVSGVLCAQQASTHTGQLGLHSSLSQGSSGEAGLLSCQVADRSRGTTTCRSSLELAVAAGAEPCRAGGAGAWPLLPLSGPQATVPKGPEVAQQCAKPVGESETVALGGRVCDSHLACQLAPADRVQRPPEGEMQAKRRCLRGGSPASSQQHVDGPGHASPAHAAHDAMAHLLTHGDATAPAPTAGLQQVTSLPPCSHHPGVQQTRDTAACDPAQAPGAAGRRAGHGCQSHCQVPGAEPTVAQEALVRGSAPSASWTTVSGSLATDTSPPAAGLAASAAQGQAGCALLPPSSSDPALVTCGSSPRTSSCDTLLQPSLAASPTPSPSPCSHLLTATAAGAAQHNPCRDQAGMQGSMQQLGASQAGYQVGQPSCAVSAGSSPVGPGPSAAAPSCPAEESLSTRHVPALEDGGGVQGPQGLGEQAGRAAGTVPGSGPGSGSGPGAVLKPVSAASGADTCTAAGTAAAPRQATKFNPIDHIFQFHQALRKELRQLEADALHVEATIQLQLQIEQQQQQQQQQQEVSQQQVEAQQQQQEHGTGQVQVLQQQGLNQGGPAAPSALLLPRHVAVAVQALEGRFQFLWGIYRSHSLSEDEIVFPALESKQALRNVSHAYTLDHQQEEQLFLDLEKVIDVLRRFTGSLAQLHSHALAVRRMCAAVRASLETHIRAEESELWPLFTEHFSTEEQQYLVGVIIGRTGAQVLQTLLPWIAESFCVEEKEQMLGSLRQATKNTMFDQWLEAVTHTPATVATTTTTTTTAAAHTPEAAATATIPAAPTAAFWAGLPQSSQQPEASGAAWGTVGAIRNCPDAAKVTPGPAPSAAALAQHPSNLLPSLPLLPVTTVCGTDDAAAAAALAAAVDTASDAPSQAVESSTFRPGWEDIFRMNQKQLEAAVMRVSADPTLEPGRKAYLIQNIMVSKYIVAQQRRMQQQAQQAGQPELHTAYTAAAVGWAGSKLQGAAGPSGDGPASVHHLLLQPPTATGGALDAGLGCQPHGQPASLQGGLGAGDQSGLHLLGGQGTGQVAAVVRQHVRRTFHDAAAGVLGCKHYKRRAQLVAPCCSRVVTCRLCHDEAETHRMDRYAVTEMVCMECGVQQPVAGECWACAAKLARYYCNICHLLDDEPGRSIYHCPFCNVCRRGRGLGIDFFHCMSCNSCMSLSMFKKHVCRERAMESNCPVCSEYLFDSADPIKELPCGHLLHSSCFAEYTRYNYTCPLCSKSVGDMRVYFQMLDSLLASETLPPEYSGRMQQVLCNDCSKTGFARFHFAYHACPHCRSYNTRVI